MVPSSVRQRVYWAAPGSVSRSRSLERACCRVSWAPAPRTSTFPRWERSNTPTASRTARCSARVPWYTIGMSQPANAPILASRPRWTASSGERCRSAAVIARLPLLPAWGPRGADGRRGVLAQHPVGPARRLQPGVVGAHAVGVADDLDVVDGQAELLGDLPDHLRGADPSAGPLAVGGHRHRGGVGDHGLGLDEELDARAGAGELPQRVQVVGGRLAVHRGDLGAAGAADAEVVEEAQRFFPAGSVGWTIDSTWRDSSMWGSSVASAMSRTLQRTRSRMETMPIRLSSTITGR